jgi:hypothetical protein
MRAVLIESAGRNFSHVPKRAKRFILIERVILLQNWSNDRPFLMWVVLEDDFFESDQNLGANKFVATLTHLRNSISRELARRGKPVDAVHVYKFLVGGPAIHHLVDYITQKLVSKGNDAWYIPGKRTLRKKRNYELDTPPGPLTRSKKQAVNEGKTKGTCRIK